jgi:Glycosyl hydrolase 109, C-terminal domain/Oxidoreductase family, NAD-binding Rossmann fold
MSKKLGRRAFIGASGAGIAGAGLAGRNILGRSAGISRASVLESVREESLKQHSQRFNMCGYRAPKLETVRVGFIGLGSRGPGHVVNMSLLEGVDVKALCDVIPEEAEKVRKRIEFAGFKPDIYTGDTEAWRKMCDRDDIDLVYICTPWHLHAPMAIYAMEHGKHVAIEVPAVNTLEECWQLVETSEKTRKHCMMMENCCYDFFELLTLNMARQGFFGDIVHGEGAYLHTLLGSNFSKTGYSEMWRLRENASRRGNLYPTHGLGPICQIMDINRGDKMDYLVSVMSNDFMMNEKAKELSANDNFFNEFVDNPYRGNMTTTTIRTNKGRTIMVQHDVTSPNVYSRIHKVSGTKASALKYPLPGKIAVGHRGWVSEEELKSLEEKYAPPIVKKVGEMAKQVGGHGGMDFLEDWRLVDCLRNGLPLDQDVYDAALWTAIAPLSEWSVANRSNSIDVPDFTGGSWRTNHPVDILMKEGGNTEVIRKAPPRRRRRRPASEGVQR